MIFISRYYTGKNGHRIRIERPTIRTQEEERLWRAVHKYLELIPSEPDPNLGRVQEIKEDIRKDRYLSPEMIDEAAARLAMRLMPPE